MQNNHDVHPTLNMLVGYTDSPRSGENETVRKHLVGCAPCRLRVAKLTALSRGIKQEIPLLAGDNDESLARRAALFVDREAGDAPDPQGEQSPHSNPELLRAALHYATHSAAMRREIATTQAGTAPVGTAGSVRAVERAELDIWLSRLKWLFSWRNTMPVPLPLAYVALLTLALMWPLVMQHGAPALTLAVYQDKPLLIFKSEQAPGASIGFFGQASQQTVAYGPVSIVQDKHGSLLVSWSAVAGAKQYDFSLYKLDNSQRALVKAATSDTTQAVLRGAELAANQRYEWRLSGVTSDGRAFSTSGGVVAAGGIALED